MKKILYIYGYGGSAQGSTSTMLRRLVPEGYMVESFAYTQADFAKARQEILDYIREHGIDLVVGSSLGGFIALTLSGIPRIVVNPCWYPGKELPLIDVPHEIVRTYAPYDHWVQEHITEEDRPMVHAFFGDRDELFADRYIAHFLHHYLQEQCHRIPSGHNLSEEGAREIVDWIDKNPQFINAQNYLQLNQIHLLRDHELIEKCEDTSILLDFFRSRKNLVLSVYKILLESERNNEVYEEKLKTYRKLTKQ